jgi:hypothetical protein
MYEFLTVNTTINKANNTVVCLRGLYYHYMFQSLWIIIRWSYQFIWIKFSETYIYCSRIIRFPGSVVQFLWSLSESYFNHGSHIYCFPGSIVSFSDPQRKRWIEVSLYYSYWKFVWLTDVDPCQLATQTFSNYSIWYRRIPTFQRKLLPSSSR